MKFLFEKHALFDCWMTTNPMLMGKEDKMSALPALFFFHLLLSFKEAFQE